MKNASDDEMEDTPVVEKEQLTPAEAKEKKEKESELSKYHIAEHD